MNLADLCALTLLFSLLMYVWLDGADLGVGMLFSGFTMKSRNSAWCTVFCRYGMPMKPGWCW